MPAYGDPMPAAHLVHHLGVFASDFTASESFYTSALAALDVRAGYRTDTIAEYWIPADDAPSLSLEAAQTSAEVTRGLHLAFEAADRSAVDAFHRAAVAAGGTSRHEPRHWPEYRSYAAFVNDPDGNNIEALVKEVEAP
jgi:catechol 2,3-dioxygenase-like lactoylglutathione lyase family enzyme